MRNYSLLAGILMLLCSLVSTEVKASHAVGADLTYTCLGGNQYRITLSFYRDCDGISAPGSATVDIVSASCGVSTTQFLSLISQQEVSALCPGQVSQCGNSSSSIPGIEQYIYEGTFTFPANCSDWRISYDLCCRNAAITNLVDPDNEELYVEAFLNNTGGACNNSPFFTTLPTPYLCFNQQFFYNHGVVDADGDSLVFSLVNPLNANRQPIGYTGGHSVTNPMTTTGPFVFDAQTGQMSATPSTTQNAVVTVLVQEYRNGVLIGSTMRDMQFVILGCSNNLPTLSGIDGTNQYSIDVCPNVPFCFNVFSNDADAGQMVTVQWNNAIQTATFNTAGTPHPTGTFCWTPTSAHVGSSPHVFTVRVQDDNCPTSGIQIYSYTINVVTDVLPFTLNQDQVICPGGSATFDAGPGYTNYQWTTGATTQSITASTDGLYGVRVTDTTGCTGADTASLITTTEIQFSGVVTDALCNGSTDGTVSLTTNLATALLSYQWSNGATTQDLTGVGAGTYNVTMTDTLGCFKTASFTVTQPAVLTVNLGADVTIPNGTTHTFDAGTGYSSYAWSNAAATQTITVGTPGTYSVTVTNGNGCTATDNVQLFTFNANLNVSVNTTNVTCNGGSDGGIDVTVSGGVPPYSYAWSTGATTQDLSGLTAGVYSLTITDDAGTSDSLAVTITQPAAIVVNLGPDMTVCSGNSFTFDAGAGFASYAWSTGATTQFISPGTTGTYSVTVTDQAGCTGTDAVNLNASPLITITENVTNVTCNGGSDGAINITVSGGTAPLSYAWSNGATTQDVNGLSAGSYDVTVTDDIGCTEVGSYVVTEPALLTVNLGPDVTICFGDAYIFNAGVGFSSYNWSNGATTQFNTVSAAGTYAVTVTDASGCTATDAVDLAINPEILVSASVTDVSCMGANDGAVDMTVTGGSTPYTYEWAHGPTTEDISGLSAGTYMGTVTDDLGCEETFTVNVTQPTALSLTVDNVTDVSCNGFSDGAVEISVGGGTTPYNYAWSNGATVQDATGLAGGVYTVTVTDANGCMASTTATVAEPSQLALTVTSPTANGGFNLSCNSANGSPDGVALASLTGGTPPYTYSWASGQSGSTATGLDAGTHSVTCTDANGCTISGSVTLTEPDELIVTTDTCHSVFFGYGPMACTDLEASAPIGGLPPYSYTWSTGETTTVINVCPSTTTDYYVVVTDANGCTDTSFTTVYVADASCGKTGKKVAVCHYPPGNPDNPQQICIGAPAVGAHVLPTYGHFGCHVGECGLIDPCTGLPLSSFAGGGSKSMADDGSAVRELILEVYPNPASNNLSIMVHCHNCEENENSARVFVTDVLGKQILNYEIDEEMTAIRRSVDFDINNLPQGVYFVYVQSGNQKAVQKIIKH